MRPPSSILVLGNTTGFIMFNFYTRVTLLALTLLVSLPATSATLEELFEQPTIKQIKISPTGDYLALRVFADGGHTLLFMKRESRDVLGGLNFRGTNEVGDFYWANEERVVAKVYDAARVQEAPKHNVGEGAGFNTNYEERPVAKIDDVGRTQESLRYFGELYAVNYDGKNGENIYGYRSGEEQVGSRLKKKSSDYAWADMIDPFPGNDREILISSTSMSDSHDRGSAAIMLDVYSGLEKKRIHVTQYANGDFFTDKQGDIRLTTGVDESNNLHVEGLPAGAQEWIEFPDTNYGSFFTPIAITDDLKSAYVLDNINSDKIGLYRLSLDGKEYKKIYSNDDVDVSDVNLSTDGRSVYAMRIDRNYPSYLVISKTNEEAKHFKNLLQTFPGLTVDISSRSDDGQFWIVQTSSDVDAGSFYLFDEDNNSIKLLFKSLPNINADELSVVEPIEFDSFDGRKIAGYFTLAKIESDAVPPLVVLVHGGPRSRDYWQYDPEVQALATQGFSVLQINYRGSSGYGDSFMRAGNLQWGDSVQQDIISGTRWAIANGKANKGNICIMGANFGAYSAVQSAILEPDLFACAVANAGIYDLELMYKQGDIADFHWGDAYLEEVIGRDEAQLRKFSPVHNIAALKIPVFIAHGKQNESAPYEHAKRLKKALDEHDKQYEWFVKGDEARNIYDTENQVEYMTAALEFLNKNLKRPR